MVQPAGMQRITAQGFTLQRSCRSAQHVQHAHHAVADQFEGWPSSGVRGRLLLRLLWAEVHRPALQHDAVILQLAQHVVHHLVDQQYPRRIQPALPKGRQVRFLQHSKCLSISGAMAALLVDTSLVGGRRFSICASLSVSSGSLDIALSSMRLIERAFCTQTRLQQGVTSDLAPG